MWEGKGYRSFYREKQRSVAFLAGYPATEVATQIRMHKHPGAEFGTCGLVGCVLISARQEML